MGKLKLSTVDKAVRKLLQGKDGGTVKLIKVQRKVLNKLQKKHKLEVVHQALVNQLIQQVLSSRDFKLQKGKLTLVTAEARKTGAAAPSSADSKHTARQPAQQPNSQQQQQLQQQQLQVDPAVQGSGSKQKQPGVQTKPTQQPPTCEQWAQHQELQIKQQPQQQRIKQQQQHFNGLNAHNHSGTVAGQQQHPRDQAQSAVQPQQLTKAAEGRQPAQQVEQQQQLGQRQQQLLQRQAPQWQQQPLPQPAQPQLQQWAAGGPRHTVLSAAGADAKALAASAVARVAAKQDIVEQQQGDAAGPDGSDCGSDGDTNSMAAVGKKRKRRSGNGSTWRADYNRTDVKHGRFNDEEKAIIATAIKEYAEMHGLPHGHNDYGWLVDRKSTGTRRGAMTSIATALPNRTRKAVWQFVRSNYTPVVAEGRWTPEEDARLIELYNELGPKWLEISQRLGRLDRSCRDRARDLNYGKPRTTGRWSGDEVDLLQSLVQCYQEASAKEAREGGGPPKTISKSLLPSEDATPRALANPSLEGIDWTWVASHMGTRTPKQILDKWMSGLAASMFETGQWAKGDDKKLVVALIKANAAEAYEVNWDSLVQGRNAEQCKRRWRLLLKFLPVEVRLNFSAAVVEMAERFGVSSGGSSMASKQQRGEERQQLNDSSIGDGDGAATAGAAAAGVASTGVASIGAASTGADHKQQQKQKQKQQKRQQQQQQAQVAAAQNDARKKHEPDKKKSKRKQQQQQQLKAA